MPVQELQMRKEESRVHCIILGKVRKNSAIGVLMRWSRQETTGVSCWLESWLETAIIAFPAKDICAQQF